MRHSRSPAKILVADDEAVIATTLRTILEQSGFRVAVAFDDSAAVKLAATFEPDVLVTDVQMPKLDGIEAALQVVARLPQCNVVLYTAHNLPPASVASAKAQGHDFPVIQKPIAPGELLDRIRDIIKQRRSSFHALVLNVDDNDMQRYAITRLLEHRGLVVREARTGAEALELAMTQRPDLVLLDINLPDISGFDVCKRLKAMPATADIPVVHLTNTFRDDVARATALSFGAADFFTHPVQPDTLLEKIRELTAKH